MACTGYATCVRPFGVDDRPNASRTPSHRGSTSDSLRPVDRRRRGTVYPTGIVRSRPAPATGRRTPPAGGGSPYVDRRPLARGDQQPRQVLQRRQPAATGGKHRQRAGRFHRSIGHGHGRRHRRRPVHRDAAIWLQGQLRGGLVGRRQEIRARSRTPARCPSTPPGIRSIPPMWSAATQLDAQVLGTGWDTNRRILTINDSTNAAVPFRLANLSPAQQSSLNAGGSVVTPTPTAQAVLNYLRGDKSNEGVGTTNFRTRTHVLGDIVYSGVVAVGAPSQPYLDAGNPGYQEFVTSRATRTPMVYVGSNDGMVHAFNDSTGPDAGKEMWAYIPKALFSGGDPNDTAHSRRTRVPARGVELPSRRPCSASSAQVLRQRHAARLGHRFRQHQHQHAAAIRATIGAPCWWEGSVRAGARSTRSTSRPRSRLTETEADDRGVGRVLWEFTEPTIWATSSTHRRWSRPTASAGSCWSRRDTTIPAARASCMS